MNLSKIHHIAIIVSDYEVCRSSRTSWALLSSGKNYRPSV